MAGDEEVNIDGAVTLITGAAGSIGTSISQTFASNGARLILTDRHEARLSELVDSLKSTGAPAPLAVIGDITEPEFHDELITRADSFGGLDISVLNAGVYLPGLAWEAPLEQWRYQIEVNFWGVAHGVRAALPGMVARGRGHVVAVASGAGLVATPGLSSYVASKHAVVGLMESVRHELNRVAPAVGVSVVCPGNVISDLESNSFAAAGVVVEGLSDVAELLARTVKAGVDAGTQPEVVSDAIIEAVGSNRFWVLPHPEVAWAAADRTRRIQEGEEPVDLLG